MTKLRVNAPVEQAAELLDRFATLGAELATMEANREAAIAATNATADALVLPIVEEMQAIAAVVEPWWQRNGAALLPAKRKTMELGGCMIGTRAGRSKLVFTYGDDKQAVAALGQHRWAKALLRVTTSLDRTAISAALNGKRGDDLRTIGFATAGGGDAFVLERVKQAGTIAA